MFAARHQLKIWRAVTHSILKNVPKCNTPILPAGMMQVRTFKMYAAAKTKEEIDHMKLIAAAASGNIKSMQDIIAKSNLDPNRGDYDSRTSLHLAAGENQLEVAKFLVEKLKVDVNCQDRNGRTPLETAIEKGHMDLIVYLRENGGVIAESRTGSAAKNVLVAASSGNVKVLQLWAQAGMSMTVSDYDGRTALHLAAAEGQEAVVKFLLDNGADPMAEDRFGNIPIMDAHRERKMACVKLLRHSEEKTTVMSFDKAFSVSTVLQQALPVICQRGGFDLAEAWVPTKDSAEFSLHEYWFSLPHVHDRIEKFAKFKAGNMRGNSKDHILGECWSTRKTAVSPAISQKDIPGRYEHKGAIQACIVVPIIRENKIHALLQLYTYNRPLQTTDPAELEKFTKFVGNLFECGVFGGQEDFRMDWEVDPGIDPEQPQKVFKTISAMGVFSNVQVYNEVEWFYKMGIQHYYFSTRTIEQLADHVLSYIASKRLAVTLGNAEDIWMKIEKPTGNIMMVVPSERNKIAAAERQLERIVAEIPNNKSISLEYYKSARPHVPGGTKKIAMYVLRTDDYLVNPDKIAENNTDLDQIASAEFSKKDPVARQRYQTILNEAVGSLSPVHKIFDPASDGSIPLILAFNRGGNQSLQIQNITQLTRHNNMLLNRKFIVTFANKMTVMSLYIHPSVAKQDIQNFVQQFNMLQIIPPSALTPMFLNSSINSDTYAYASSVSRFVYYFINQRTEEYEALLHDLQNDKINLGRLKLMYTRLKTEAVSSSRIHDTIFKHQDLIIKLSQDFANRTTKKWAEKTYPVNTELVNAIKASAATALDQQVLLAMYEFNASVLKTNLYKADKSALTFRLSAEFLGKLGDWPLVPYGVFFLLGSDFQGFHIRFKDVSRGGIRLIKSVDNARYNANLETQFAETYNLAYTQNNKNKDIPEFGSKGTILLHPDSQANGFLAFRKYASGILDLLVPSAKNDIVDNYGREEFLFLGPDEGTADMMAWAAFYARDRQYRYWRAFTTGKPSDMGGVPHDVYGMTTRSVHRYVLGSLKKMGLKEEDVTKVQTGGPDGDLGSNEILISKDKTKAVIDGAGVIFDPAGLDRTELCRLAKKRVMIHEFDVSKLGAGGFKVLTNDRNVKLPTGEVVENGTHFRNNFHLHPLCQADMFVPCGGRPEAVNLSNVKKLLDKDGKSRFKIIVEGANLFFSNDARMVMEQAGAVLYKDASSNKGGVTSSSMEVFAALCMNEEEFKKHMCVTDKANPPAFYQRYVKEVQTKIELLADLEFECIWREHDRNPKQFRYILTDQVSGKINELADFVMQSDSVWNNLPIRKKVLLNSVPKSLVEIVGYDNMMERVPESYMKAIFATSLASRYVYEYGVHASEFTFFEFMQNFTKESQGK